MYIIYVCVCVCVCVYIYTVTLATRRTAIRPVSSSGECRTATPDTKPAREPTAKSPERRKIVILAQFVYFFFFSVCDLSEPSRVIYGKTNDAEDEETLVSDPANFGLP